MCMLVKCSECWFPLKAIEFEKSHVCYFKSNVCFGFFATYSCYIISLLIHCIYRALLHTQLCYTWQKHITVFTLFFHSCIWHLQFKTAAQIIALHRIDQNPVLFISDTWIFSFWSMNWNVCIQWTIFCTKIIHDNMINLNNWRYVRVFCCVASSSVRSWKRSQSLFTSWGDFRLFYFWFQLCVGECFQNSLGLLVVIRQLAGPAGLCSCQSPQEWCLKRETTGSEIAVYSLSSRMNNVCRFDITEGIIA